MVIIVTKTFMNIILIVLCTWLGATSSSTAEIRLTQSHPIVHVANHGPVRGNTYGVLNKTVHVFWSIPFAEPPIGRLRFQHPVPKPVPAWSGVLDGTKPPNVCNQFQTDDPWMNNVTESEDCLYMNVYVPNTVMENNGSLPGTQLPVMFFIYGGAFVTGASSFEKYNSSALAIMNDVIVVTSNYRLGAFGWLYSASEEAPGNAGLYDQLTALRWVHDNIRSFGGDPENVTIFGNSAGSISVGLMIMSKLTNDLFHKAILMSGVIVPQGSLQFNTAQTYLPFIVALGDATNCSESGANESTLPEVVACLKQLSADDLMAAQKSQARFITLHGPVLDKDFFLDSISTAHVFADIVTSRNLTILMGVVTNEGGGSIVEMKKATITNDELHAGMELRIKFMSKGLLSINQRLAIHYMYTNWNDVNNGVGNRQLLADVLGDAIFVCPMNDFAAQLSKQGIDVYFYSFNERPSISIYPEWEGVVHGNELRFVFGHPLDSSKGYTAEEAESSRRLIKIFGNFAKYGVPSYDEINSWPKYASENKAYVELNSKGDFLIKENMKPYHCAFWNNLIPNLARENCTSI